MKLSEKSKLRWLEAVAKKHQWKDALIVGLADDAVIQIFLANCPRIKLTVTFCWRDPASLSVPERLRQEAAQARAKRHAKAYAHRLTVHENPQGDALAGVDGEFDGVVLAEALPKHLLGELGLEAAGLARDGGWLVGYGHRDIAVRDMLDTAVGEGRWKAWREGMWGVPVERSEPPVVEPDPETVVACHPSELPEHFVAALQDEVAPAKRKPGRPRKIQPTAA